MKQQTNSLATTPSSDAKMRVATTAEWTPLYGGGAGHVRAACQHAKTDSISA
jgi:hypothetical protein